MKKMSKKSGFTLVEMLIVVAIIAILIAIAIPLISTTLEKAREAVDQGNWRSAISLGNAFYLTTNADELKAFAGSDASYANGVWVYFAINENKEGYIVKDFDTAAKPNKYGEGTAIGNVKVDLTDCVLAVYLRNPPTTNPDDTWPIVQAVWVKGTPTAGATGANIVYNPATGYIAGGTNTGKDAVRVS